MANQQEAMAEPKSIDEAVAAVRVATANLIAARRDSMDANERARLAGVAVQLATHVLETSKQELLYAANGPEQTQELLSLWIAGC